MLPSPQHRKSTYYAMVFWLISSLLLIAFIVVIGGITRLTDSGLSMVNWKPTSILPPMDQTHWQSEFTAYQQFPEFQKLRPDMSLTEFKHIYFWEYTHRMIARLIGLWLIIPFLGFWLTHALSEKLKMRGLVQIGLVILQGIAGWLMVKSGLINHPDVSHYRLALHLGLAFLLFQYVLWTLLNLTRPILPKETISVSLKRFGFWILILVCIQILYGAFTAGTNAGFILNTFPQMNGHWIEKGAFQLTPWWENVIQNPILIQFIHRWLGVLIGGLAIMGVLKSRHSHNLVRNSFRLLASLILIQVILGVCTLLFAVPIGLGLLHQLTALAILSNLIYIQFLIRRIHHIGDIA